MRAGAIGLVLLVPSPALAAGDLHVPPVAAGPFVFFLLAIAVLPLVAARWWHKNRNKAIVAGLLAGPTAGYLLAQGESGGTLSSTSWPSTSRSWPCSSPCTWCPAGSCCVATSSAGREQTFCSWPPGRPRQPDRDHRCEHAAHPPGIAHQLSLNGPGTFRCFSSSLSAIPAGCSLRSAIRRCSSGSSAASASSGPRACGGNGCSSMVWCWPSFTSGTPSPTAVRPRPTCFGSKSAFTACASPGSA